MSVSQGNIYHEFTPSPDTSESTCLLLDSIHTVTPTTSSIIVTFEHFNPWRSRPVSGFIIFPHFITMHTVRVIPVDRPRSRINISSLPVEILLKIFEEANSYTWQHELLSCAQVCRHWSWSAMTSLFARLESPEWKDHRPGRPPRSLDLLALAETLCKTPALGLGLQDLHLDHAYDWYVNERCVSKEPKVFLALVDIIGTTKNLRHFSFPLGGNSSKAKAVLSALSQLDQLHTVSIKGLATYCSCWRYRTRGLSVTQVAHCLACCPALTSFTVQNLLLPKIGIARFFMRPPACALTHLCIRDSWLSDTDLMYLTASSVHTLSHVTFSVVYGVTHAGLRRFLASIAGTLVKLSICLSKDQVLKKSPLDAVVDRLSCLETLEIEGMIATEGMLHRRSEMFVSRRQGGLDIPVVRLSFRDVPALEGCMDREWAGWEVVKAI